MNLESNFCFSKTLVDICQRRHVRVISVNVAVVGKQTIQDRPLNLEKELELKPQRKKEEQRGEEGRHAAGYRCRV